MSANDKLCETSRAFEAEIRQVRENTETRFLRIGSSLISVCDRFDTLEKPIAELAEIAAEGEVKTLATTIREFTSNLEALLLAGRGAREPLQRTVSTVRRMRSEVAQLARTIRIMRIVALNARVVVAPINDRRGSLTVFTRDARELVQKSLARLEEVETALSTLDADVEAVRCGTEEMTRLLGGSITQILAEIVPNLEKYETYLGTLTARGGKLSRTAESIRNSVGQSVLVLQSGDAMRQRMEHCEGTLRAVCNAAPGPGLSAALLVLARRHLVDLSSQYRPQLSGLERQLGQATKMTMAFLSQVEEAFRPGKTGAAVLLTSFATIEQVLSGVADQQATLTEDAQSIMRTVTNVQTQVREIGKLEAQMNLIGVNAVLACTGLGPEGLPLKEIAHQLRDLVAESGRRSTKLHSDLEEMHGAANDLSHLLADQAVRISNMRSEAEETISSGLNRLRSGLEGTREAITRGQQHLTTGIQDGLSALIEQKEELERLVKVVAGNISPNPRYRQLNLSEAEADLLAKLRAALTIEIEREIHDSWLATIGVAAGAAEARSNAFSTNDELFFDQAI